MSCEKLRQQIGELRATFPEGSAGYVDAISLGHALGGACDNGGTHTARLAGHTRKELIEFHMQRSREFLNENGVTPEA